MKKFLKYLGERQLRVQGMLLWLLALVNLADYSFWLFAIPAIIACGMQDILDEVRKLNEDDTGSNF